MTELKSSLLVAVPAVAAAAAGTPVENMQFVRETAVMAAAAGSDGRKEEGTAPGVK